MTLKLSTDGTIWPSAPAASQSLTRVVSTDFAISGTYAGTYWFLVADNNGNAAVVTSALIDGSSVLYTAPGSDPDVWQQASEYEVILTKMLFAKFANLGSFIVYGQYFFSQYGQIVNASGTVVQAIDANNTDFDGQVGYSYFDPDDPMATTHATHSLGKSVWFRPTKCIDALTGEEW